jgi:hypothetical protein
VLLPCLKYTIFQNKNLGLQFIKPPSELLLVVNIVIDE